MTSVPAILRRFIRGHLTPVGISGLLTGTLANTASTCCTASWSRFIESGDRRKRARFAYWSSRRRAGTTNMRTPQQIRTTETVYCTRYLSVSYTHLRAHETGRNLVCRLL